MDLKKVSGMENLGRTEGLNKPQATPATGGGPSFQDTLNQLGNIATPQVNKGALANLTEGVKFSNHAVERMQSRGIKFNQDDIGKLNEAVSRAAAKGSKDTLVLMNDSALIVSVKNKTVVTVMDKMALKENVFTNIDSTIVM
jgi:flagellar operon protein